MRKAHLNCPFAFKKKKKNPSNSSLWKKKGGLYLNSSLSEKKRGEERAWQLVIITRISRIAICYD